MLPSSVSCEGKPYVDDRGEREREGGSPRDYRTSKRRANEDYKGRDKPKHRDKKETNSIPQGEPGCFRMEPWGYARHIHRDHPARAKCRSREKAHPAKTTSLFSITKPGNHGWSQQIACSKLHLWGLLHELVGQRCPNKECEQKMEDGSRFHGSRQGLSKRQLSPTKDRSASGFHNWT